MLIDRSRLKKIIATTFEVMDEKQMNSLEDLERWEGHKFIPDSEKKHEYVQISERPSSQNTIALVLSYISEGLGVPLDINVNKQLGHSIIILKYHGTLENYSPFMRDLYGNIIQERQLQTTDVQEVKTHLRGLL